MKKRLLLSIAAVVLSVLPIVNRKVFAVSDEDVIPPEVLKQMDPEIRAGKRPTIAKIRQGDIFGLREKPQFEEDFVTFDFTVGELSSVQRSIIKKWVKSGSNRIYLKDRDISKYAELVEQNGFGGSEERQPGKLLRHVVNTDCKIVSLAYLIKYGRLYYNGAFKNLPPDSVIIVEGVDGKARCGMFHLGEGTVYFCNTPNGPDSRRWYLNYMHWVLGLGVPGAADTDILGGGWSGLTLKQAVKYDAMTLKNGDTITGTIENETFRMKTSYGDMTFKSNEIAKIVFEGAGSNVDVVRLKVGDKLSGVVQDKKVKIKLVSGTSVEIDKDKIKEI